MKDSFSRSGAGLTWRTKTRLLLGSILLVLAVIALTQGTNLLNQYQVNGEIELDILDAPVRVVRDARGMPYISAANRRDMIRAQGFVVAQDRLFQLEMYRAQIWGRLSRYLGPKTVELDTTMRVLGLTRAAAEHVEMLSAQARQYLQDYLDGLNFYIVNGSDSHPIELSLVGLEPTPWTLTDALAVLYFINYETGANLKSELIALAVADKLGAKATGLVPLNVNPMRTHQAWSAGSRRRAGPVAGTAKLGKDESVLAFDTQDRLTLGFGSNAWALAPARSATGAAVLANDPHLDATILPGIWYPMGLSAPGFNAVGGALPGVPGLLIGRNNAVAWSMTNGYGDTQDLYVERVDPNAPEHYLEGDRSIPFARRVETIRVKDEPDVTLTIRSTRRGPVISDHALGGRSERVLSHRWSVRERQLPELGFDRLMFARSASEVDQAIQQISLLTSNIVFADNKGNIGFRASGTIPIRVNRDGSQPQPGHHKVDHWAGFIPANQMPGEVNPPRGWVASANNDVRPDGYPYYYSSYFSAAYRFTRIRELLSTDQPVAINAHPQFQLDMLNLQARRLVPVLVPLLRQAGHNQLAASLDRWDLLDRADSEGALVYHLLYQHLVRAVLTDELGTDLADQFFAKRYYWIERLDQMIESGESPWFDDQSTPGKTESLTDLVSRAANDVERQMDEAFGSRPTWGDAHRVLFVSPLRLSGSGAAILGGGEHAIGGSNETLFRSTYDMGNIKRTRSIDSARMIVDFSDLEKVKGVVAGGHASRQFHASQKSYLADWLNGELGDWWLAPPTGALAASTLLLHPTR